VEDWNHGSEVADTLSGKQEFITTGRAGLFPRVHEQGFPNPFYRWFAVPADRGGVRFRLD
jgi:hypothetical protein